MKRLIFPLLLMAIAFVGCDKDDDNNNNDTVNDTDRDFVMRSSVSNTAEIVLGQMAAVKGEDDAIRNFGQTMVTAHTDLRDRLLDISVGLNLYAPDSIDASNAELAIELATLSGRAFDSTYIKNQEIGHRATIELYERQVAQGANRRLKEFARSNLENLRAHLELATSLSAEY